MTPITVHLIDVEDVQHEAGFEYDPTVFSLGAPGTDVPALWVSRLGGSGLKSISLHLSGETDEGPAEGIATWLKVAGLDALGPGGSTLAGSIASDGAVLYLEAKWQGEPGLLQVPIPPTP